MILFIGICTLRLFKKAYEKNLWYIHKFTLLYFTFHYWNSLYINIYMINVYVIRANCTYLPSGLLKCHSHPLCFIIRHKPPLLNFKCEKNLPYRLTPLGSVETYIVWSTGSRSIEQTCIVTFIPHSKFSFISTFCVSVFQIKIDCVSVFQFKIDSQYGIGICTNVGMHFKPISLLSWRKHMTEEQLAVKKMAAPI